MVYFNDEDDVAHAVNAFRNWFDREDPDDTLGHYYDVMCKVVDECVKGKREVRDARKVILKEFESKELADIVEDLIYAMKDALDEGLTVFWAKVESDFN